MAAENQFPPAAHRGDCHRRLPFRVSFSMLFVNPCSLCAVGDVVALQFELLARDLIESK
jgi:hypothetical protein